jgi:hypothetical protein
MKLPTGSSEPQKGLLTSAHQENLISCIHTRVCCVHSTFSHPCAFARLLHLDGHSSPNLTCSPYPLKDLLNFTCAHMPGFPQAHLSSCSSALPLASWVSNWTSSRPSCVPHSGRVRFGHTGMS